MKFEKLELTFLLNIGLGLTFLASSLSAFLTPDEFEGIIKHSLIFAKILDFIPFFIILIGINDFAVCILLISRLFPKIVAWYATVWVSIVIIVFLSQASLDGAIAALEHLTPLGVALYLALKKQPLTINPQQSTGHLTV